uniref:Uncharacterized protein n=1 Tax=Ananas comosus var. bracteatus TaxID=296719 RepID=A0A6V7QY06_ANACO
MPQVDLETLVCGGGGSDGKVSCETLIGGGGGEETAAAAAAAEDLDLPAESYRLRIGRMSIGRMCSPRGRGTGAGGGAGDRRRKWRRTTRGGAAAGEAWWRRSAAPPGAAAEAATAGYGGGLRAVAVERLYGEPGEGCGAGGGGAAAGAAGLGGMKRFASGRREASWGGDLGVEGDGRVAFSAPLDQEEAATRRRSVGSIEDAQHDSD